MPRRGFIRKRVIPPDPVFNSELVARFINKLVTKGKKSIAEKIFYGAMDIVKEKTGKEPLSVFEQAIKAVQPLMAVKPRRVGGATYQVPVEVEPTRGRALAMQWLRDTARNRAGKSMQEKLAAEILDAVAGVGGAAKKREDTHKMAEANRAFAHFRW